MDFVGTFAALIPPIIAIILALLTKEVYISLFVGITVGAMLYSNFGFMATVETIFTVMKEKLGDSWNISILIFVVFLGIIVCLMTKAGGSAAYGKWAASKIKSRKGAMLATFTLGLLIFVDDAFNCLTVGSVMRPVTDKYKISRAKLAYIIDATAAPVCIIATISSWAAAVAGYTSGDGFSLFLKTIPYNLYAWLSIVMVLFLSFSGIDFGPMAACERFAFNGQNGACSTKQESEKVSNRGTVLDLILPIAVLIISCILCMVYTGGFFSGTSFIKAFADCNAATGLMLGSFFGLIFTFLLYIPRRVLSFREFADCIPQGLRIMTPAILILTLAWTLGGFCRDYLDAGAFVARALSGSAAAGAIFPAVLFAAALGLAFATGTSWGTFGILIPIVTAVYAEGQSLLVISISAILAGAVCGDHISPISDTTIMASAGAQCDHVLHVSTQIPYAIVPAVCCLIGYLAAGFTQNVVLTMGIALALLAILLYALTKITGFRAKSKKTVFPTTLSAYKDNLSR